MAKTRFRKGRSRIDARDCLQVALWPSYKVTERLSSSQMRRQYI